MKREIIEKTAFCYFSGDDNCFVVESSKVPIIAGVGDTVEEAWNCFNELLTELMRDFDNGKVDGYSKPGRPAKNGVHIHSQVKQTTKCLIDNLAGEWQLSQADVLDHLAFYYQRTSDADVVHQLFMQVADAKKQISDVISTVEKLSAQILATTTVKTLAVCVDEKANTPNRFSEPPLLRIA